MQVLSDASARASRRLDATSLAGLGLVSGEVMGVARMATGKRTKAMLMSCILTEIF